MALLRKTKTIIMKKNLIYAFCIGLFLTYSCKKENVQSPSLKTLEADAKKYPVNFDLTDFQLSNGSISKRGNNSLMALNSSTSADSLGKHINNLVYLVYDSTGKEVSRIRQFHGSYAYKYVRSFGFYADYIIFDSNKFGSLQDTLAAGKYTVCLFGSNYKFTINQRDQYDPNAGPEGIEPLANAYIGEKEFLGFHYSFTEDSFYKKFSLTVNNEPIKQDLSLDRITGKLEINILDAIPANANKFEFRVYYAATHIKLATSDLLGDTHYADEEGEEFPEYAENFLFHPIQIKPSEKGMANYQYIKFLFGRSKPVIVKLRCVDASGKLIANKTVKNVLIYKNRRTILKGRLFDNRSEVSFNVSVNSEWDPQTVVVPF